MKEYKSRKWATYRRQMLDYLQDYYKHLYKGVVLDIGGRDRGNFIKPKEKVKKWIFADINSEYNPDIILDVTDMHHIQSDSIDIINAIELFEHVKDIEKGLKECYRVLKKNGLIFISMPFLYPIHADPNDFQRWTSFKWKIELSSIGFKVNKIIIMGKFYTNLAEIIKIGMKSHNTGKKLLRFIIPFLDLIVNLDNRSIVINNKKLNNCHNGYFIIAKK